MQTVYGTPSLKTLCVEVWYAVGTLTSGGKADEVHYIERDEAVAEYMLPYTTKARVLRRLRNRMQDFEVIVVSNEG